MNGGTIEDPVTFAISIFRIYCEMMTNIDLDGEFLNQYFG